MGTVGDPSLSPLASEESVEDRGRWTQAGQPIHFCVDGQAEGRTRFEVAEGEFKTLIDSSYDNVSEVFHKYMGSRDESLPAVDLE